MKVERSITPPPAIDTKSVPEGSPLRDAAEGMEANFLKEMMRNLRKTVQEAPEEQDDKGLQLFRGMLDDHYAESASKSQGIGLAEMIIRQVLEQQQQQNAGMNVPVRELNKSDVIKNQ